MPGAVQAHTGSWALLLQGSKDPQPHLQTGLHRSRVVEIPQGAVEARFRTTVSTQLELPSQLYPLALRVGARVTAAGGARPL